jgi:hypothetical protein
LGLILWKDGKETGRSSENRRRVAQQSMVWFSSSSGTGSLLLSLFSMARKKKSSVSSRGALHAPDLIAIYIADRSPLEMSCMPYLCIYIWFGEELSS